VHYRDWLNAIQLVRKQGGTHDARCRELTASAMKTGNIPCECAEDWLVAIAEKYEAFGT